MAERLICNEEVTSSNLVGSTRQENASKGQSSRFARRPNHKVFWPKKSVGDSAKRSSSRYFYQVLWQFLSSGFRFGIFGQLLTAVGDEMRPNYFKYRPPNETCSEFGADIYALYCTLAIQCNFYIIYICHQVKKLGGNLRKWRLKKDMSQGDLATALSVDRAYISNIENGRMNPTLSTLEKIANALGISSSELLK